jgi:very-short-patch-repair endonuclease
MTTSNFDAVPVPRFLRTRDLRAEGVTWRGVSAAVAAGVLIRLRQGAYCPAGMPDECVVAGQLRGRLACVSELRRLGVFVRDRSLVHVHVPPTAARLPEMPATVRAHRRRLRRTPHPRALSVEILDALHDAVTCQDPRAAIATLDSALHLKLIHVDDLDELFAGLPRRYRRLRRLLDARAESGPETLVRLMLRGLGCRFEPQVVIVGVGRVDFLVDGWLIVECDSAQFHAGWAEQRNDRRRDAAAAAQGYLVLRLIAEDIMWRPEVVMAALRGALAGRRGAKAG